MARRKLMLVTIGTFKGLTPRRSIRSFKVSRLYFRITKYYSRTSANGTSLQRPLFSSRRTKNPYIDSWLKPLYNSHLFTRATFFCPQGDCCIVVSFNRPEIFSLCDWRLKAGEGKGRKDVILLSNQ